LRALNREAVNGLTKENSEKCRSEGKSSAKKKRKQASMARIFGTNGSHIWGSLFIVNDIFNFVYCALENK